MKTKTLIVLLATTALAGAVVFWAIILSTPGRLRPVPPPRNETASARHSNAQESQPALSERPGHISRRESNPQTMSESLPARMMAAREKSLQEHRGATASDAQKGTSSDAPATAEQPKLTTAEFVAALREAIGKADPNEVRAVLEKVPQDAAAVEALKAMLRNPAEAVAVQRHAADALLRIGTADAAQFVLDQILAAYRAGDETRASALLPALEAPTTTAGMQALFDFLLGRGQYAQVQDRPEELVNAARKALRLAPDREAVGNLAASLYLDPQVMANTGALWELFDGVSHPVMLAKLATRAYQEGLSDNAGQFLARLGESDDQGTVQALVEMVPHASVPIDYPAMALYDWSLRHPQQALAGLFLQYLTDTKCPPEQRSVAAFGLAGVADTNEARRALEKALNTETDPVVRANVQTALRAVTGE